MARLRSSLPVLRTAGLTLLLAAGLTTACGSDDSTDEGSAPVDPARAEAFPVTVEHMYGETEIPEAPTRIVTLGLSDQDSVLALGEAPIAVSEWYGEYPSATWPWATDELGDAEPVVLNDGVRDEANPPVEEVAGLEPDLILSLYNGLTEEQYTQLSDIAPVVVPTEEFADFTITWQESMRVTGQALGREDEALSIVDDLEQRFADAAAEHPEFEGQEVVVAERFEPGESIVRSGNDIRARFFDDLGFESPTEVAGNRPDEFGEIAVSDEEIDALSRDLLVWNVGSNPEVREEVEAISLYDTLPVVQEDRVLWLEDPEISGAFSWGTALSLEFALDELVPQISETVD